MQVSEVRPRVESFRELPGGRKGKQKREGRARLWGQSGDQAPREIAPRITRDAKSPLVIRQISNGNLGHAGETFTKPTAGAAAVAATTIRTRVAPGATMIYARARDTRARASFTKHLRMRGFMAQWHGGLPPPLFVPASSSFSIFFSLFLRSMHFRQTHQTAGKCVAEYHCGNEKLTLCNSRKKVHTRHTCSGLAKRSGPVTKLAESRERAREGSEGEA